MREHAGGFSLIEAIVCLAIGSLLLCVAVNVCKSTLARVDASAARAALLSSLTEAVHHSAMTGTEVVLCPGSITGCRNSFDWSGGWIAYADIDGDRRWDAGETVLREQPALSYRVRLLSSTGRRRLVFHPTGGNTGSNVTFTLCDTRGAEKSVTLVMANDGRLRAGKGNRKTRRRCIAAWS